MKTVTYLAWTILILSTAVGCAAVNRPRMLERSQEVNRLFEDAVVLPDHVYYYTGPQDRPDAIIAIRKDYELQKSVHWVKINITEKQLRDWDIVIDNQTRIRYSYDGFYIMDPNSQQIGIFYSKYTMTVIKYPAPNKVVIYPPDPTPDQRRRERFSGY